MPPRMRSEPAWYHGKAAFYCVVPLVEVLVVVLFAASRVDQRFYVEKLVEGESEEVEEVEV